jgi:hypothetical protein
MLTPDQLELTRKLQKWAEEFCEAKIPAYMRKKYGFWLWEKKKKKITIYGKPELYENKPNWIEYQEIKNICVYKKKYICVFW